MANEPDNALPISYDDVLAAERRIRDFLPPTPLRRYPELDRAVGSGARFVVKHENHQPTNAFKVRNGLSALAALDRDQLERGVVAATRGNHGQGVAWAGRRLGAPVTICVPVGNSPTKNRAMVALGANLVESGRDYDESVTVATALADERGLHIVHSTNDATIIAGAGTMTLELLTEDPDIDAIVVAVGGGSQAVGAITVARARSPRIEIYGVQAEGAPAIHDGWHEGQPVDRETAITFADGVATRQCYDMTFPALLAGLTDFVTVTDAEIAAAIRLLLETTHNLAEGAGAASLAGAIKLGQRLAGKRVAVVISGANIDFDVLRKIVNCEM